MTDEAARYQELIGRGYPEKTARHIVAQELNDNQVDMMVACGMIPEPRPLRRDDVRAKADALDRLREVVRGSLAMTNAGIVEDVRSLLADYDQQGKMIEQLAAKVHRLADRNEQLGVKANHGRTADGGIWATFCTNQDCNILGCPGDCMPAPKYLVPRTVEDAQHIISGGVATDDQLMRAAIILNNEVERLTGPGNCTCEPKPTGEAPDEPDYDCPVHGQAKRPEHDPRCASLRPATPEWCDCPTWVLIDKYKAAEDVPDINGEPAW